MTFGDTSLATALAVLAGDLTDPSVDLGPGLARLTTVVRAAVPSYCGLSITVLTDGIPVTITAPHPAIDPATDSDSDSDSDSAASMVQAATSLVLPLSAISRTTEGELVFFAAAAGAFVDLAADLAYETATDLVMFALDTRLGASVGLAVGVEGFSVIHRALGVLIESGHTPEQARARIAQLAAGDGHDLAAVADRIVNDGER